MADQADNYLILKASAFHIYGRIKGVKHGKKDFNKKGRLFQEWPELDFNYNLRLIIKKNGSDLTEMPMAVWRFRQLASSDNRDQEAFDLACCLEPVQNEVLKRLLTRFQNCLEFNPFDKL